MGNSRDVCNCCNKIHGNNPKYKLFKVDSEDLISKLNQMNPYRRISKGMFVCEKCRKKTSRLIPQEGREIIEFF